jgi:hypothetical protein
VREWAPTLRAGGAGRLMRLTERLREPKAGQLREAVLSDVGSSRIGRVLTVRPINPGPPGSSLPRLAGVHSCRVSYGACGARLVLGGTPFANRVPHSSHSLIGMLRSRSYLLTHRCIPTQQRNGLLMAQGLARRYQGQALRVVVD